MKWSRTKIQQKWNYFREQRKTPTGNFTEFVVRTYYSIDRCCREQGGNNCPSELVSNRQIKNAVYDGIYPEPDHGYDGVIGDCKKHLTEMGYIHTEEDGRVTVIDRPLDFLLPGEHEAYLARFAQDERREEITGKTAVKIAARCPSCGGRLVLRTGRYGLFFGCENFPSCRTSRSVADVSYDMLKGSGLRIYRVTRPCWKCRQDIEIISYFPYLDLTEIEPELSRPLERFQFMRLSVFPGLDETLCRMYGTLQERYSKKAGFSYIGNICPHCGALQGSQMTLGEVYSKLRECAVNGTLHEYIGETLPVTEETLARAEWKEAAGYLLGKD